MANKPILCVDFDGVLHAYTSGWCGADVIPDPPVDGAMLFLWRALDHFRVAIFSSRSNQAGGIAAMQAWLTRHFAGYWIAHPEIAESRLALIEWPTEKPAAFVTLDDRAIMFEGVFPPMDSLLNFKPWNKRAKAEAA